MNFIDRALGVHPRALEVRSKRMELLAQNIANADTPNYKARDVSFRDALAEVGESALNVTQSRHIPRSDPLAKDGVKYRVPFNVAFDGNTVELNVEQAQYGKAATDFQATLNFLESRISSMRKALKGE